MLSATTHGQQENYMTTTEKALKLRRPVKFKHFMVDCETLGVQPNRNPVLQLAIVEFDPDSFVPTGKEKTIFLPLVEQLQMGVTADKSTVEWWGKQNHDVLKNIMDGVNSALPMEKALLEIYHWVNATCKPEGADNSYHSMFWAKPTLFDYPFIDGLFISKGIPSPFNYRNVIDMSSFIISNFLSVHRATRHYSLDYWMAQQLYWNAMDTVKNSTPNSEDSAHDATSDCKFQLKWLREAVLNTDYYLDKL